MHDLPRGTVTFLFTDVEGSTRLLKRLGDRYTDVLRDHQHILRQAFEDAGGREIDSQGDSFFVAFPRAKAAVEAAVSGQLALASHRWPQGAAVRVRMGLHTGEPLVGDNRYVGLGVHKAARIGAAAHGGQVLLSNATRELVDDELPSGVRLVDLGEHSLKDIDRPERVFQVGARGLSRRFPPLRVDAPAPRSRFPRAAFTTRRRVVGTLVTALALAGMIAGLAVALDGADGTAPRSGSAQSSGRTTAPGEDPQMIVPGVSIGAARIGMAQSELEMLYGPGTESQWRSGGRTGTTMTYAAPAGVLAVSFSGGRVVQVRTTSSYYVTEDGIRVGSAPPYPNASEQRKEAALRSRVLVEMKPGVFAWRNFVYENLSYCLRGDDVVTQLVVAWTPRVNDVLITDAGFLEDLPSRSPWGDKFFCTPRPLQR